MVCQFDKLSQYFKTSCMYLCMYKKNNKKHAIYLSILLCDTGKNIHCEVNTCTCSSKLSWIISQLNFRPMARFQVRIVEAVLATSCTSSYFLWRRGNRTITVAGFAVPKLPVDWARLEPWNNTQRLSKCFVVCLVEWGHSQVHVETSGNSKFVYS